MNAALKEQWELEEAGTYRFDRSKLAGASRSFVTGAEQRKGQDGELKQSELQHCGGGLDR